MKNINFFGEMAESGRTCFLPAAYLLAAWLTVVTQAQAENPPTFLFEINSNAVSAGFSPWFLALDSSNNVYVTDSFQGIVDKFTPAGVYLAQGGDWGGLESDSTTYQGVAVGSDNNVYAVDQYNGAINKFDANGNLLARWGSYGSGNGQLNNPLGIAVDSNNSVYVADTQNNRIEKFDSNGSYLSQWGSFGSGSGQFEYPEGIAVDKNNNVYVVDTYNGRIEKFNSNGTLLFQLGSQGNGIRQFNFPAGIAVDDSNNFYVSDTANSRVEKFDSNGNYLTQWGTAGDGNGQFDGLVGIATDSTGNLIYVADLGNSRIEVFARNTNNLPPYVSGPANQTVPAGANVTLSVTAAGTGPFSYQWMSNNIVLPGVTNAAFSLNAVNLLDSGTYSVLITNPIANVHSQDAVLLVEPAVVLTLPVNDITSTSAGLNGSVTVASDTTAWLEWGIDTNYGNIAGETLVPAITGTTNLAVTVGGLDGNLAYHYRMVATNIYGTAYGSDQLFKVGVTPSLGACTFTNLTTNSVVFKATVNPNGRSTVVYFISQGNPAVPTVEMAIGSGIVATNVVILVTNLTVGTVYSYREMASNSAGTDNGALLTFQPLPWTVTTAIGQNWQAIAASADGNKLAAAAYGGNINTSTNAGSTWAISFALGGGRADWSGIASSADGTKLVATTGGLFLYPGSGTIYTSTNSGESWTTTKAPQLNWDCVASSADGTRLAAVATAGTLNRGPVYTSSDSGATWVSNSVPAAYGDWSCVACSADGNKLLVAVNNGLVYSSTNAGVAWTMNNLPATNWESVASSADGNKLVAAVGGYIPSITAGNPGPIFTSTNAGATWTQQTNAPIRDWFWVASSADGNKLAAVVYISSVTNAIFTSVDGGVNWTDNDMPVGLLECVAASADGSKLAAVENGYSSGHIYTLQTVPSPLLTMSLMTNQAAISWTIPSLSFALQQSPDLLNWTNLTNQPVLNLTNLQDQVTLPLPVAGSFFRLAH